MPPGVSSLAHARSKSATAAATRATSPVTAASPAKAIAANISEKTYRRLRSGRPSRVTVKNIRPSASKQCRSRNSTHDRAPASHSSRGSTSAHSVASSQPKRPWNQTLLSSS